VSAIVQSDWLGDGFSQKDIEAAIRNMTDDEVKIFLDLNRLDKADRVVTKIRQPEVFKAKIKGVWRDAAGPMLLLRGIYGKDGSHEPLTMTENHQWQAQGLQPKMPFPYKPFPPKKLAHLNIPPEKIGWDYLDHTIDAMLTGMKRAMIPKKLQKQKPSLYIAKTREMITSWLVCGFIFWHCQFFDTIGWIGQSEKDEKAQGLVQYVNVLYENQPDFLRARFPLLRDRDSGTAHRTDWKHGSWFRGVPQGERQLASSHPFGYFSDESAHQAAWEATIGVVTPAVRQIICVSSAAASRYGDMCQIPTTGGMQQ
jgi:hypothetical protein